MKIALFTETYLPNIDGVGYTLKNWKEQLEERGHEVTIICPSPLGSADEVQMPSFEAPIYQGYHAALPFPVDHDFSDYDIIHINGPFGAGLYGSYLAKKHDIPLIATMHTPGEEYLEYVSKIQPIMKLGSKIYKGHESYVMNQCDVCTTPTAAFRDELQDQVDLNLRVLSNGVDTEFFHPQDADAFRERYDITADKVIGYTGRLGREKHLEDLISIADDFDGEIIIGGEGPMKPEYEAMAANMDNVTFLGFLDRDELPEFYNTIDIFIFPSCAETEGIVALEANACGTPVVGADAKGLRSTIKNGINGLRYEPGNADDLMNSINKTYDDMDRLKEGSLEHAADKSMSATIERLLALYHIAIIRNEQKKGKKNKLRSMLPDYKLSTYISAITVLGISLAGIGKLSNNLRARDEDSRPQYRKALKPLSKLSERLRS
jgi:glycosyltransferase involved in cell wall biosynthesis